jgi:hypothetical protein
MNTDYSKAIWARYMDRMMNEPNVFDEILKEEFMNDKKYPECQNNCAHYDHVGNCVGCDNLKDLKNVSEIHIEDNGTIRQFETGATRDTSENKPDLEGYLCPKVLKAYAEYMLSNQKQTDGTIRPSDNWQKGIPQDVYMKSMWRHFHTVWLSHREGKVSMTDLMALVFNVMGYAHEELKK